MSIENFKVYKKLQEKKYRKLYNKFLIDGEKLCDEAVKYGIKIEVCLVSDKKLFEKYNKVLSCVKFVDNYIIKMLSTAVTPQSVVMIGIMPNSNTNLFKGNTLVLDGLQDMGNVGTLLRSACAFNFKNVILINSVDIYDEKVLRSSMGAVFKLNIIRSDFDNFISHINNFDQIIIADMYGEDLYSSECEFTNICLVLGNEGNGISQEFKQISNKSIKIPMSKDTESLNVAVAGSIIMSKIYSIENI